MTYTRYSVIDWKCYCWQAETIDEEVPDNAKIIEFDDKLKPFPIVKQ